jgi:FkbM family methyltransferase
MRYINSYRKFRDLIKTATGISKIKVFVLYLILSFKKKTGMVPCFKKSQKIELYAHDEKINFFIKNQLDFDVLWDSMCIDQYEIEEDRDTIETILDIGSNIGTTVIAFYYKFPNAKIYAFEPDPHNFKRLQENVSLLPDTSRIILNNVAVSDVHGEVLDFYVSAKNHWSSSLSKRKETDVKVTVKTTSLDGFCKEQNILSIDLVKMDIEGAESKALDSFDQLNSVKYFLGEIHPGIMDDSIMEFILRFKSFNIEYFDTVSGVFKFVKK